MTKIVINLRFHTRPDTLNTMPLHKRDVDKTLVEGIIKELYEGKSLKSCLDILGLQAYIFFSFLYESPDLMNSYDRAQQARTEMLVDEIVEIADTEPDPQKARVRTDCRKWVASKMKPNKYGERLDININQTVDISSALTDARKRALPNDYQKDSIDTECVDITGKRIESSTD